MLAKLYKHEFKDTAKSILPVFAIMAIATITNLITMKIDNNSSFAMMDVSLLNFIIKMLQVASILVISFFIVYIFVQLIRRFTDTMTKRRAYLTHTLPVSSKQLILVKSTVSGFWMIVSTIVAVLSWAISSGEFFKIPQVARKIIVEINRFCLNENIPFALFITEFVIYTISCAVISFLLIYLAISIGQLSNQHPKLISFVAFVGVYIFTQTASGVVFSTVNFFTQTFTGDFVNRNIEGSALNIFLLAHILMMIFIGIIAYFTSSYLFDKKINIQ